MQRVLSGLRWLFVTIGIIVLTSLTIDATTEFSMSQSALGIFAREITDSGCGEEMAEIAAGGRRICVDRFEASTGSACPHSELSSIASTRENLDVPACVPESKKGAAPWIYVNINQARELCARVGKRLPIHKEWHLAALGTADPRENAPCNVSSRAAARTGSYPECITGAGAYDMIGNVWEWVEGQVEEGRYEDRTLPQSGYVSGTDEDGVALSTSEVPDPGFHEDYFWSSAEGSVATIRGGFFGSRSDAGTYAVNASVPLSFASQGVGFRCVKDL